MAHRSSAQDASSSRSPFSQSTSAPPTSTSSNAAAGSNTAQGATAQPAMPPELEQTLALMSTHRSVLGYLLITRGSPPRMIRHSGIVFDGEQGRRYATVVARIVETVQAGLEEIQGDDGIGEGDEADVDEVRFMRIRTKKHEIMISPDDRYLLAVLHDPGT